MSYDANIERMRSAERANVQQAANQRTSMAQITGDRQIREARDVANKLSHLSGHLQKWKEKDIEKKQYEGKLAAREAREENAEKLYELSQELETVKEQDTRYHEIKAEMLKLQGPSAYPDADRIAKLSPWAQVGYAQEKLRVFNESYDSKLAHAMQNSEKAISISGISITPKELHDNNISDPILKEAAIQVVGNDIKEAAQLDRFSPELLKLAGTSDAITKAKDAQLAKYRTRYNIESSANTRGKAVLEWKNSAKNGDDIYRYLLVHGATIDESGNVLGNSGAWGKLDSQLVAEGIALDDPDYAARILEARIPDSLAAKLGVKKGTTFEQQWPSKAQTLRNKIKDGIKKKVDAESDWLKTAGKDLENKFIEDARKGSLSTQEVNEYKRKFGDLGLPIPTNVTKYETVSMRDQREDKQAIEALIASQDGYISHEQLDSYHPLAAAEFRDKATKLEKEALKNFDADKKIKAHLDTVWTSMGVKANEKSPAYVEAMANAKADYAKQYNEYIAMGHDAAHASYLALRAKPGEATDENGEPIPGRMGVLTEIETNKQANKYITLGQNVEQTLKPGKLRVAQIHKGKREVKDDPNIVFNGTIGGDYGHRQLTTIKNNIDKYGSRKGTKMDKGAIQYYKGLARGTDMNWMGLVDAQLKATGHPGLWPDERPAEIDLLEGKDKDGNAIEDPNGLAPVAQHIDRASRYTMNPYVYQYMANLAKDARDYEANPHSYWDESANVLPYYR